jgi:Prealbumin-like fold domain
MSSLRLGQLRQRRWLYAGVTLVTAAVLTAFSVSGAFASTATLSGSTFEGGDGNLTVDVSGQTDWCTDFPAPAATATCTTPFPGLHTGIDKTSGTSDNSFGQGTKEDNSTVTVVSGSIPPNKSDLTRFYEASELGSNNHVFLYLAWERTNNLGNANMDFEINQSNNGCPNSPGSCTISRTNGDILVTYDFSGSGTPTLGILRWLAGGTATDPISGKPETAASCFSSNTLPCWGDHEDLNSTDSQGAVDTGTSGTVDPINPNAPRTIVQNGFGEAAIDLTAAGVITSSNGCEFGSATTFLKSRSSSSFTSEIKDFISPVSTPLINNCGALGISKVSTKGGALAGATFEVDNSSGTSVFTGTTDTSGSLCATGLQVGSYTVKETVAPSGYDLNTASQPATVSAGSTCANNTVTFKDTPLTDISVNSHAETSGATSSTITCTGTSDDGVTMLNKSSGALSDPANLSATGLHPGTYTCTITIDP